MSTGVATRTDIKVRDAYKHESHNRERHNSNRKDKYHDSRKDNDRSHDYDRDHRRDQDQKEERGSSSYQSTRVISSSHKNGENKNVDLYWYLGLYYYNKPSIDQIKAAHKTCVSQHHPDKTVNKSKEDQEHSASRMREINQAKDILLDPERKQAYDENHIISDLAFEAWKRNRQALTPFRPRSQSGDRDSGSSRRRSQDRRNGGGSDNKGSKKYY